MPRVEAPDALFHFLQTWMTGHSRNKLKGLLTRGQITVDGKSITQFDHPLLPGQMVEVLRDAPPPRRKLPFPLIYEDEHLIVINKPAGLLSVATDTEKEKTAHHMLAAALYGELEHVGKYGVRKPSGRLHIVHRLDRETSGLLLFAKSLEVKDALQNNWDGLVSRRGYLAVVEGCVPSDEGRLHSWLKQTKTLLVYSSHAPGSGQEAITDYKALRRSKQYSLMELTLKTGRKNQIRVHMKDLGYPVAGDKKYGSETNPLGRVCLHAFALTLRHPVTGKTLELETAFPAIFEKAFEEQPKPALLHRSASKEAWEQRVSKSKAGNPKAPRASAPRVSFSKPKGLKNKR